MEVSLGAEDCLDKSMPGATENRWDIRSEIGSGPLPEKIVCPIDGAEMVSVSKGSFTMGITQAELSRIYIMDGRQVPVFATEIPSRIMSLDVYYIDRYPVTNYQYHRFVKDTGHRKPLLWNDPSWNRAMQPVVFIGWNDARKYASWAGKKLPSEAQWEKAARGTDGRWWAWGHEFLPGRCNSREYELGHTSEIGFFHEGISPYGCYDMCGNVWEMCEGTWQGTSYIPPVKEKIICAKIVAISIT